MIPILSLLLVIVMSLLIVRIATVALTLTGLSQQLARFQARSAFTGAGFTTNESEKVVQHPIRRRIIMTLMLLGNAGFVTAVSSLILSFTHTTHTADVTGTVWFRVSLLATGLFVLWVAAHSQWVDASLSHFITWAIKKWSDLEVRDYAGLLHLSKGYAVVEMAVEPGDWMAERQLLDLKLADEGVLVLGIQQRNGTYLGAPRGLTRLSVNDTVLMYGPKEVLRNLDRRRAGLEGNHEHRIAVDQQRRVEQQEQRLQRASAEVLAAQTIRTLTMAHH